MFAGVGMMKRDLVTGRSDEWVETVATIVSCKRTLTSSIRGAGLSGEGFYEPPEYAIVFHYTVGRRTFSGRYRAGSVQEVGSTIEIAYDPARPDRNTGSDLIHNPQVRLVAWLLGIGLAALAMWLGL